MRLLTSLFILASLSEPSLGYPNGAGSCAAGKNAIQGSHLTKGNVLFGSLSDGDFSVSIGGVPLVVGATSTFLIGVENTLQITAGSKAFKGFLIRLGEAGGATTYDALTATSSDVKVASECTGLEGVGGVTHVSNSDKTVVTATLKLDEIASDLPLDVTVVVQNSGNTDTSEYFYSGYFLSSIDSSGPTASSSQTDTPSPVPVTPDTSSPMVTKAPTPAPIVPATPAPVLTNIPTIAPVVPATPTPVVTKIPTIAPVVPATPTPVVTKSPTIVPVVPASPTPVATKSPTIAPNVPATPTPVDTNSPTIVPVVPATPTPVVANSPTIVPVVPASPIPVVTKSPAIVPVVPASPTPVDTNRPAVFPISESIPSSVVPPPLAFVKTKKPTVPLLLPVNISDVVPVTPPTIPVAPVTSLPTPEAVPGPVEKPCEDDMSFRFIPNDESIPRGCFWLSKRPLEKNLYCIPDSEVMNACEETCGKCSDTCCDNNDVILELDYRGGTISKNCLWLREHLPLSYDNCVVGSTVYSECKETCNNCHDSKTCRDSELEMFTFATERKNSTSKTCAWLASQSPKKRRRLCLLPTNSPSDAAAVICPHSCGMCTCSPTF